MRKATLVLFLPFALCLIELLLKLTLCSFETVLSLIIDRSISEKVRKTMFETKRIGVMNKRRFRH